MQPLFSTTLVVLGVAGALSATPIPIVNPSFGTDALGTFGSSTGSTPTGWTDIGAGQGGTLRPSDLHFNTPAQGGGSSPANNIPDGLQTYWSNGLDIGQVLTSTVGPAGSQYTLSLFVGRRWDLPLPSYTVELLAGGSILATATDPVIPGPGQFGQITLLYTTTGAEAGLLEIRLINTGGIPWNPAPLGSEAKPQCKLKSGAASGAVVPRVSRIPGAIPGADLPAAGGRTARGPGRLGNNPAAGGAWAAGPVHQHAARRLRYHNRGHLSMVQGAEFRLGVLR